MAKSKTPPKPDLIYELEGAPPKLFVIRFKPNGTWWCPDGHGYTEVLERAGTFSHAKAHELAQNRPYEDEAVPLEIAVRELLIGANPVVLQAIASMGVR